MAINPTIAVAIPTHNRPGYLQEALASVEHQTLKPHEVIIVDDASTPPVDNDTISAAVSVPVRLFRNESPKGLAWNRNKAANEADAEYLLHLDDDDLLAPHAIRRISEVIQSNPSTEMVFISLSGFGNAEHFNRVQPEGTRKLLSAAKINQPGTTVFPIEGSLSAALLRAVPTSFQHPVVQKKFWHEVSALRSKAYAIVNGLSDRREAFNRFIQGPLRDSEWSIYSSFIVRKAIFIDEGLYLARCEGQGFVSKPEHRYRQMSQSLIIKRTLFKASDHLAELHPHRSAIRSALRTDLFNTAYTTELDLPMKEAWSYLLESARLGAQLAHFKLALRLLLRR